MNVRSSNFIFGISSTVPGDVAAGGLFHPAPEFARLLGTLVAAETQAPLPRRAPQSSEAAMIEMLSIRPRIGTRLFFRSAHATRSEQLCRSGMTSSPSTYAPGFSFGPLVALDCISNHIRLVCLPGPGRCPAVRDGVIWAYQLAKVAAFSPYTFRPTCLTRWAEYMDPFMLAYWAGYSDFSTTRRYVHPQVQTVRDAVGRFRNAQSGAKPTPAAADTAHSA